jgi:hypothetical protein
LAEISTIGERFSALLTSFSATPLTLSASLHAFDEHICWLMAIWRSNVNPLAAHGKVEEQSTRRARQGDFLIFFGR